MRSIGPGEASSIIVVDAADYPELLDEQDCAGRLSIGDNGWVYWPDREDLSHEFVKVLAAAQEGAATVSECWATVARIDPCSDSSWSREWIRIAERNEERAAAAFAVGNSVTAQRNWLRAVTYFQAAAGPIDASHELFVPAIDGMRRCAGCYVRTRGPAGEVVSIPWLEDLALEGYLISSGSGARAPVVIILGEPGTRKEQHLSKYVNHAHERRMTLLAVDLLGPHRQLNPTHLATGRLLEAAVSHIVDYLLDRPDVDPRRIAIIADGWESSFVSKAVAADNRFAAAVCDGGLWDLQEKAFLDSQARRGEDAEWLSSPNPILRGIDAPLLITAGENGWLEAATLQEFGRTLQRSHPDATMRLFSRAETAASQAHADNPTIVNEVVFDWLSDRMKTGR